MASPASKRSFTAYTALCWTQGAYYALLGVWPLVNIDTFLIVTGKKGKYDNLGTGLKADHWLVYTVGLLIVAVSIPLLIAAARKTRSAEVAALGIASAGALMAIDIIYTQRRVIEPIYLLDAAIELTFLLIWVGVMVVGSAPSLSPAVKNKAE